MESTKLEVGQFGRAHGIGGELRLFCDEPVLEVLESGTGLIVETAAGERELTVEQVRRTPTFAIVELREIEDRTEAERLTNCTVYVSADAMPSLEEGEYYQVELVGCEVRLPRREGTGTRRIGEVGGFFETGSNDVMVVLLEEGGDLFVPMVEWAVSDIDPEAGRVVLAPLEQWAPDESDREFREP